MRKTSNNKNNEQYYTKKGYKGKDLDKKSGKPKRCLASFQIETKLWKEFDKSVEKEHGKYKKSYIIENLIRKYLADPSAPSCSGSTT